MISVVVVGTNGPLSPCSPPVHGSPLTSTDSTTSAPLPTPFDHESVAVSIGGLVLLLALVAALILRRLKLGRLGGRVIVLVVLSLAFAAFAAAWIWQLKTSYAGGGCALYFDATPFSEDQAFTLAPLLTLLVGVLALVWVVVALTSAFRRRAAKA